MIHLKTYMKKDCLPLYLYHLVKKLRQNTNTWRTPGLTISPDACMGVTETFTALSGIKHSHKCQSEVRQQ